MVDLVFAAWVVCLFTGSAPFSQSICCCSKRCSRRKPNERNLTEVRDKSFHIMQPGGSCDQWVAWGRHMLWKKRGELPVWAATACCSPWFSLPAELWEHHRRFKSVGGSIQQPTAAASIGGESWISWPRRRVSGTAVWRGIRIKRNACQVPIPCPAGAYAAAIKPQKVIFCSSRNISSSCCMWWTCSSWNRCMYASAGSS